MLSTDYSIMILFCWRSLSWLLTAKLTDVSAVVATSHHVDTHSFTVPHCRRAGTPPVHHGSFTARPNARPADHGPPGTGHAAVATAEPGGAAAATARPDIYRAGAQTLAQRLAGVTAAARVECWAQAARNARL